MRTTTGHAIVLLPALAICAAAQHSAVANSDRRVPVHTHPDDPAFGAYGKWATGDGYKISFHDGPVFYPVLGRNAPRNMPVEWQTLRVERGGAPLLDTTTHTAAQQHTRWRYEYHYPGLVERYDVRREGVEQSFVVDRELARGSGDLVVVGRLRSELAVVRDAVAPGPAALRLVDPAGVARVRYGSATAFDANQRAVPVATETRGDEVRLVVPGSWLRDARWPVVIDPLLSPVVVGGSLANWTVDTVDIAERAPPGRPVLIVETRWVSSTDRDVYAYTTDRSFGNGALLFTDVSAAIDTNAPSVAFVDAAQRWVIAFARATTVAQIRLYRHDAGNLFLNSGSWTFMGRTGPQSVDRNPDIGGSNGNLPWAAMVFQSDVTTSLANTANTELRSVLFDAATGTLFNQKLLGRSTAANYDRENGRVTQRATNDALGNPVWGLVWQERNLNSGVPAWDVWTALIAGTTARGPARVGPLSTTYGSYDAHPDIAGAGGSYAVSCMRGLHQGATTGEYLDVRRFDWPSTAASPTLSWTKTPVAGLSTTGAAAPALAHDTNTGSHWIVTYRQRRRGISPSLTAVRLGFDGNTVETAALYTALTGSVSGGAVAFHDDEFWFAYATSEAAAPLYGRALVYPAASATTFGVRCGGSIRSSGTPLTGLAAWRCSMIGGPQSAPAALMLSTTSAATPLDPLGMRGCVLHVGLATAVSLPTTTSVLGTAGVTFPLTGNGTLYWQWLTVDRGANPAGLTTSNGLRTDVR